jgi:hypothetical protein
MILHHIKRTAHLRSLLTLPRRVRLRRTLLLFQPLHHFLQPDLLVLDQQHGQDEVTDAHSQKQQDEVTARVGGTAVIVMRIVFVIVRRARGRARGASSAPVAWNVHHGLVRAIDVLVNLFLLQKYLTHHHGELGSIHYNIPCGMAQYHTVSAAFFSRWVHARRRRCLRCSNFLDIAFPPKI